MRPLFASAVVVLATCIASDAQALRLGFHSSECPDLGPQVSTFEEAVEIAEATANTTLYIQDDYRGVFARGLIEDARNFAIVGGIIENEGFCARTSESRTRIYTGDTEFVPLEIRGGSIALEGLDFEFRLSPRDEALIRIRGATVELTDMAIVGQHRVIATADPGTFGGGAVAIASLGATPSHVKLRNVFFGDNSTNGSGGAIFCNGGRNNGTQTTITLSGRSTFVSNRAAHDGGAIYLFQTCTLTFEPVEDDSFDHVFDRNRAGRHGGAIAFSSHERHSAEAAPRIAELNDARFAFNSAGGSGGAVYANGKGRIEIESGFFRSNDAADSGGGVAADSIPVHISATTFSSNSATQGGALSLANDFTLLPRGVAAIVTGRCDSRSLAPNSYCGWFNQNEAFGSGGAISAVGYGVQLRGYALTGNTAAAGGAAIAHATGPSLNADLRKVSIENVLIDTHSGAPMVFASDSATTDLTLRHVTAAPSSDEGAALIEFGAQSAVYNVHASVLPASAIPPATASCNIPFEAAGLVTTARGNHRPGPESPAIDNGCVVEVVERDLDGKQRTVPADIGAFEADVVTPPRPDGIFSSSFEAVPE